MKKAFLAAIATSVLLVSPAFAQSPFDGTWRVDFSTAQFPDRPVELAVAGGTYTCNSCLPRWSVPADGAFHPVIGQPYFDEAAVQIADDRTIVMTTRKDGKMVGLSTITVAPDGNSYSTAWRDIGANGEVATGEGLLQRISAGPAGAHHLSGSWRQNRVSAMSDSALNFTMRTEGDTFHVSYPTGESYRARWGGAAVPFEGDRGGTEVSVRKIGDNGFEEIARRNGEVVAVVTATLDDASTLNFVQRDPRRNTETRFTARKQ